MSRAAVLEKTLGKHHPETQKARKAARPKADLYVDLPVEFLEHCTHFMLDQTLKGLKKDRGQRAKGRGMAVFHVEREKDLAELDSLIQAFEKTLSYYTQI